MSFEKRLNTFIKICYKGNVSAFASIADMQPSTISRWIKRSESVSKGIKLKIKSSDPKLSHIIKLADMGCNIAWLISGKGTMFAYNNKGEDLQKQKFIIDGIKKVVEANNPTKIIQSSYNKSSKINNQIDGEINPAYYFKLFEDINEKCNFLFINYLLILLHEKIEFQKKENALLGKEDSIGFDFDEIVPYLPIIIGALIHYIGGETIKMIIPPSLLQDKTNIIEPESFRGTPIEENDWEKGIRKSQTKKVKHK